MMAGLEVQLGEAGLIDKPYPKYDVSGIIGFSGDVVGSVVVSFSMEASIGIVEAFTGENMDIDNPDFADAIGELCNMIAGNAKQAFGLEASIGIPSIIIGPGHCVTRLRDVPCIGIPARCAAGEFVVELSIKQVGG